MSPVGWRRRAACLTRQVADASWLRLPLSVIFAWFGVLGLADSLGAPSSGTALDYAARVLSVVSVGHVPNSLAHRVLAIWECLIALSLLSRQWRLALWLLSTRLIVALMPLIMFRDDLFRRFPTVPGSGGQNALAYALLLFWGIHMAAARRLAQLLSDPRTAPMLAVEVLTPQQSAMRRRRIRYRLGMGIPAILGLGLAVSWYWPRYLKWFHARQENAVFSEKLSGRLLKQSMPLSALLGRKITTWVYLPPGYDRQEARYPVVYVMHGMPGEVRDCFVKGRVQDAAEKLILSHSINPLILVGWDGQGPTGPGDVTEFLDRRDGKWQMESFMVKELVPYIDRTYRTIPRPEARALDGVSAGGYAAVNLLIKYPGVWNIGASHTGFLDPQDDADNMTDILGPPGPMWEANNPMKTVEDVTPAQNLHFYLDNGQGDELSNEFARFCTQLETRKIDHACHVFPGRHTWGFWSRHFYDSLQFIDERFRLVEAPDG